MLIFCIIVVVNIIVKIMLNFVGVFIILIGMIIILMISNSVEMICVMISIVKWFDLGWKVIVKNEFNVVFILIIMLMYILGL